MQKIPSLDGLRAISILLVIFHHGANTVGFPQYLNKALLMHYWGILGVTIFFVLSGFLITSLLLKEKTSHNDKINIKNFYKRRFLRILPVCYLYIFIIFLLNKNLNFNVQNATFWFAITYTMNFCHYFSWFMAHLWTLAVEEQFYLFWPWATKLTLKKMTTLALIIVFYAIIVRAFHSHTLSHVVPKLLPFMLEEFFSCADSLMIGSLLAISQYTYPNLWKSSFIKNRFILLLAVFSLCYLTFLNNRHNQALIAMIILPFGNTIISLCIAYIIAHTITIRNNMTFKFLNHPLMVYIGVLSYSIYIWQQLFLVMKDYKTSPILWFQTFPVNIALVFCASILSYHLWEKNFLKLKEKFKEV